LQSVKKLFHKDSLNKASCSSENLKLAALNTMITFHRRKYFMKALREAEMAFDKGEIPASRHCRQ
jgi:hypothetical protein